MAGNDLKILIADDDSFVREMLESILRTSEYAVITAENGADAFERVKTDPEINMIISDMNMPEMNGLDLIKKVRENEMDVPIIILTGNNEIYVAVEAMKSGANDYILKDENIQDTILISVEKVWESHQLRMENIQLMEDLEEKNKELERMVFVDGLTGIANRRYFDDICEDEWGRATRNKKPISIIMIDIDFFKLFNDTYGHQQGDDCLRQVAKALDNALERSGDFVSRYGGEEFIVILPSTDLNGAFHVAQIMREKVKALKIPHSRSKAAKHVTVSLGVGSVIPTRDSDPADFIDLVDNALYEAKKAGRNMIKKVKA